MNSIVNYATNQQTGEVFGPVYVRDCPTDLVHTETYINSDWLQKLNLQKPTTVEELYDVLVAFRDKDPNGNGKKDEIPMMGRTGGLGMGFENYVINAFIQYLPNNRFMVEDGKTIFNRTEDEYREALKFIN
jgi:putative aldouronate transport system substrate-binding protein